MSFPLKISGALPTQKKRPAAVMAAGMPDARCAGSDHMLFCPPEEGQGVQSEPFLSRISLSFPIISRCFSSGSGIELYASKADSATPKNDLSTVSE